MENARLTSARRQACCLSHVNLTVYIISPFLWTYNAILVTNSDIIYIFLLVQHHLKNVTLFYIKALAFLIYKWYNKDTDYKAHKSLLFI